MDKLSADYRVNQRLNLPERGCLNLSERHSMLCDTNNPVKPSSMRKHVWNKAIAKAGLDHRTMLQTRHTFITLMLDAGEHIGWIAKQVGHTSPKMIFERYYSYIKNYQSEDGQKFLERVYNPIMENVEKTTPNLPHHQKEEISTITNFL